MNVEPVKDDLQKALRQLGLEDVCEQFLDYLKLLYKWNRAYNLTAVRDIESMVTRHILDSLAILPWVKGPRLLDVGSGAGFPGIPLAIAMPNLQIVLLDSNGKKTRFLQEAKRSLALSNVEIVQSRVENYHPSQAFDTVTSRAFSELQQLLKWTHHLIATDGIWLAMKGRRPDAELLTIERPYQVEMYTVAGHDDCRCCVIIKESTWQKS